MTGHTAGPSGQTQTEHPGAEVLLQRILATLERDRLRGGLELIVAIILSLATLASTWCSYQAGLWSGVQSTEQAAADSAERLAAEDTIVGFQLRTMDLLEVREYWTALRQKDTESSETVFRHMRPQLQQAVAASLAAGALENPDLPGPLQRTEYALPEEQNAVRLRKEAGDHRQSVQAAWRTSGAYVSLTLMFASVLFFGGITGTFTVRRVRIVLGSVSLALFLVAMVILIRMPVCG
jgi:hypothetical protein